MNQLTGLAAGVCRCPSKMPGGPRGEEVAKALWQMNGQADLANLWRVSLENWQGRSVAGTLHGWEALWPGPTLQLEQLNFCSDRLCLWPSPYIWV